MLLKSAQWARFRALLRLKALANAGARTPPEPAPRFDAPGWKERWEAKAVAEGRADAQVVFLGDSLIHNYELDGPADWARLAPVWDEFYGGRAAVNLGYAGDATENLLWRIRNGELSGMRPRAAVVLIGINDIIVHARPAELVAAGVLAVTEELWRVLPECRVLLLALLPHRVSSWTAREARRVNAALAAAARTDARIVFLDVGSALLSAGRLDASLYCDHLLAPPVPFFLHPTAEGQRRIASAMEPALAAMLAAANG